MTLQIGFLTERLILGFGVDLAVHQYASFLQEQGHGVTVFCERHEPIVERKYKVIDLAHRTDLVRTGSMGRNLVNFARFFNAYPMDIWIINTPPFYDVIPLLLAPCIAIEYGTPPSKFFSEAIGRTLDASVAYRFRYVFPHLRSCDRIHCISQSIQDWLPEPARPFSDVMYLGCDHYRRVGEAEARAFRQTVGVGDSEVLILWVGRVQVREDRQPYKGFPEFVTIVEKAMRLDRDLKFLVVGRGGGEEAEFLRSKQIISCLNLADDKMGTAYAAADIFVNTSKWEGFNLPLLEAQFQGVPVLAYNHGPHPEVCRSGETGILVDDIDSMVDQLLALANDRDKRTAFGRRATSFAATFSWAKSCSALETAIKRAGSYAPGLITVGFRRFFTGPGSIVFVALDIYRRYGLVIVLEGMCTSLRRRIINVLGSVNKLGT
jgi:glycosyltransferase involved in cell wall biosynthesis